MFDLVKTIAFPILFDDVVELSIARLETRTEEFNIAVSHCTKGVDGRKEIKYLQYRPFANEPKRIC